MDIKYIWIKVAICSLLAQAAVFTYLANLNSYFYGLCLLLFICLFLFRLYCFLPATGLILFSAVVASASLERIDLDVNLKTRKQVTSLATICSTPKLQGYRISMCIKTNYITQENSFNYFSSPKIHFTTANYPWKNFDKLKNGDSIFLKLKIKPILKNLKNSYDFYLLSSGYWAKAKGEIITEIKSKPKALDKLRRKITNYLKLSGMTLPTSPSIGVLNAITFSRANQLDLITRDSFRELGISHLLVASGFHLSMIAFIFGSLCDKTLRHSRNIIESGFFWELRYLIIFIACICFCILGDFKTTLIRSLFALGIYIISELIFKKPKSFSCLFFILYLVILIWPLSFLHVGVQLSFAAVFGILVGIKLVKDYLDKKYFNKIFLSITTPIFAWLFTSPIIYLWFNSFNPYTSLNNILITPIFSAYFICIGIPVNLYSFFGLPFWNEVLKIFCIGGDWLINLL